MPRSVGRRADHRGPGLLAEATIEDRAPGVGWPRNQPFREADHLDGNLTERFKRIFKAKTWCRDASAHILSHREHPARGTGTVTPSQLGSCFLSAASRILESGSDSSPSGKCSGHRPVKPSKMNGRKGSGMKLSRNLVITAAVAAIAVIGGGTAFAATSGASSPARSVAGGSCAASMHGKSEWSAGIVYSCVNDNGWRWESTRGRTGATGPAGPRGATGKTGATGAVGATGASTAGPSGLDAEVYWNSGSTGTTVTATCPASHPYALGGGSEGGVTTLSAPTFNGILASNEDNAMPANGWMVALQDEDTTAVVYVICSK
jgi:hypothetical protein